MPRKSCPIIPSWDARDQGERSQSTIPVPAYTSAKSNPVQITGEAPARCFSKSTLARFLGLSVRSLDRAKAMGVMPPPDLVVGRSPRWSPETIQRWLRSKPRLPGRGGPSE